MTTKAKKLLITAESREMWIVRRGGKKSRRGFCPASAVEAEMLSLDDAVDFSRLPVRELIRQTESGAVHAIETANGHLLICLASLKRQSDLENRNYEAADLDFIRQNAVG